MQKRFESVVETIGKTPIIRLKSCIPKESPHRFWAKVEYFNPGGSVKDRVALALIEDAEKKGELVPGATIIEATSGNTGLGLAMVASQRGYKCIFVMPDKISEEKRAILRAYGARVVITPTAVEPDDPRSYYSVAKKLVEITPKSFYANQYHNPANPTQHYHTTGPEIIEQMGKDLDVFVAGAGTGGTISGTGKYLKEKKPDVKVVCADPVGSILYDLYYHKKVVNPPKPYKVEGVGEDMLPDNVHMDVIDDFVQVNDLEAFTMTRRIVQEEGLCVGPSCALALVGAIKYAEKLEKPSDILVLFPDNGRGYLSKAFNEEWLAANGLLENPLMNMTLAELIDEAQLASPAHMQVSSSLKEVLWSIGASKGRPLPIVSDGAVVGIVTEEMVSQALVEGRLRPDEPVIHLMGKNLIELSPEQKVGEISELLKQGQTVCTSRDGVHYVITEADLAQMVVERFEDSQEEQQQ